MKTVGTKLANSEYELFEFCCSENGLTKSEQLRSLIKDFVNREDDETEEQKEKPTAEVKVKAVSYDDGKTWINFE